LLTAKLARDFKCSITLARDFLCFWTQSRDLYCSSTTARDFYSNKITKKIIWGWTLDIQSVVFTIQIRYKL